MKVTASVSGEDRLSPASAFAAFLKEVDAALLEAVEAVATEIEVKGRADISSAGNFGGGWTSAFKANVEVGENSATLNVTMDHKWWRTFQHGVTIHGNPLLYFKPTKAVGGLAGMEGNMPTVISKHSVTIPKKFHLIEIAEAESARVAPLFRQKLGAARDKTGAGG